MPMTPKDHLHASGAAVVVGAAQLVPLPLVDDWIASFSRRQLVRAILKRHGRTFPLTDIAVLSDDGSWLGLPWRMAKSVVLFPVKKLLKPLLPVLLARDIGLAVGRTLALSHTLDRQLGFGMLRDDDTAAFRRDQAERLRRAFDTAWKNIDQRLVTRAVKEIAARARRRDVVEEVAVAGLLKELDDRVDRLLASLPLQ